MTDDTNMESGLTPKDILAADPGKDPAVITVDQPIGADQGIDLLKSKLDKAKEKYKMEKKARQEAEQAAREAAQRIQKANTEVEENQIHLVSNAIDTLKREQELLKNTIKEAMATGDLDKTMELQTYYQTNINKLARLEDGLAEMKNSPRPQQTQGMSPKEIVNDLMTRVTPKSAKWLDKNRDALKDQKALRTMERAHGDALDQGIEAESKEYFRFIENRLGINKKDKSDKGDKPKKDKQPKYEAQPDEMNVMSEAATAKQQRYQAPAAAPVSRSSGSDYVSNNPKAVKLTPDEQEAARISQLTNWQYWQLKYGNAKRPN